MKYEVRSLKWVAVVLVVLLAGCATTPEPDVPDGYDADTTPNHNGEHWIGGAP